MENGLNKRNKITDLLCMLPAFLFALSILLVRMHLFSMPMTEVYWSDASDTSQLSDVFNYWKAVTIITAAALAVIVIFVGYFKESIRFKKSFFYVPALIYAAFVLVSFVFSDYKYFALHGMSEHFEGTIVLLSYVIMVFFLANVVDSERRLKFIVYVVLSAAFLLGVLGITQAVGNDFLSTVAGQKLITPNYVLENGVKSWDMIDILAASGQKAYDFTFEAGKVYQTVYNINYVVLYLVLLIPVSVILFLFNSNRHSFFSAFCSLILFALLSYNFFAASSGSGYFGLLAVVVVAIIVFRKQLKKWLKAIICLILVAILVLGLTLSYWLPEVKGLLGNVASSISLTVFADTPPNIQYEYDNAAGESPAKIDYIETSNDYMLFSVNGNVLRITRDNENASFVVTDNDLQQLYLRQLENKEGLFEILDDRFHDYLTIALVKSEELRGIKITTVNEWGHTEWPFLYNNGFYYLNRSNKMVRLNEVPHVNIFAMTSASGRGRIWNTTIPMLKKSITFGSGADTYCFVYPQYDYATLYNTRSGLSLITDKAHNLYMQYWVNTGLISLLAWLTLVGYYLVGAVKAFRKRGFVEFSDFVNGGIFCGIIGFLFVAFFNDGSVNTMPMFYTMLGTGLAINMKDKWVKADEETKQKEAAMPEV